MKKVFLYKIYDSDGVFVTTWTDVVNSPRFSSAINGGFSELRIRLARTVLGFGESVDVVYSNQLKLVCFDGDTGDVGVTIFSGYLTRYEPVVDGRNEYVDVTFLSYWHELARFILENAGATEVAYNSIDPSNILKDLLDKFTVAGGRLDYGTGTVDATSTTVSYTYNTANYQAAARKVLELCPDGWYLRVGADDQIYLRSKSTTADHKFTLGRDVVLYKPEKRTENMTNAVYFRGGGTLYKKYERSGSISVYGRYAKSIVDQRVTSVATADLMAARLLDGHDMPEIRIVLRLLDNNGQDGDRGYDIESVKVGDTVRIINSTKKGYNKWDEMLWDVDAWDHDITNAVATVLQIQRVSYVPEFIEIEISNRQPDIAKRIEDISRNLADTQTADNPSTPAV